MPESIISAKGMEAPTVRPGRFTRWLPYLTGLVMVLLVALFLPAGQLPGFGLGMLAGCVESLVCWYAMGGDGR